ADGVGQNRLLHTRQADRAHGRIESGEEKIFRHDSFACQSVEKCGFSCVRVTHQGDYRPRRPAPSFTMQCARLAHLLELLAQPSHALPDHSPISLDLRLARAPEESETAALALQVRPRSHEAALLVIEVCEFDLQAPFGSRRTLAEYLEDQ